MGGVDAEGARRFTLGSQGARRFTLGSQGARRLTRDSRVSVVSLVIPYSSPFFRKKIPEKFVKKHPEKIRKKS